MSTNRLFIVNSLNLDEILFSLGHQKELPKRFRIELRLKDTFGAFTEEPPMQMVVTMWKRQTPEEGSNHLFEGWVDSVDYSYRGPVRGTYNFRRNNGEIFWGEEIHPLERKIGI